MKKAISFLLVLVMVMTLLPIGAFATEGVTTFTIGNASGEPGSTVDVDITVKNNPGILSTTLSFTFDEGLTLIAATPGVAFDALPYTFPAKLERGEPMTGVATFMWQDSDITMDEIKDGVILTLTFVLDEKAVINKDYTITAECVDCYDRNTDDIVTESVSGYVSIIDYTPGDVTADKRITTKDVIWISRYIVDLCTTDPDGYNISFNDLAADVTADGKITTKDVIWISRFIVDLCTTDPEGYNIKLLPGLVNCAHEMEATAAKDATCTEEGNLEYWHCTKCDKYFTDAEGKGRIDLEDTIIAAKGHDVVVDKGYPAEIGKEGLTDGSHCARCHEVFEEQVVIPPLKPNTRSITYHIVDEAQNPYLGTLDIDESDLERSYTPGKTKTLKNLDLGKYGYTFDGWYDGFGSNATQIKEIPATANEDIEVYAHVTERVYDITYNLYQTPVTSAPTEVQLHYTVSKGNYNLYNPEINNYKFLGWYDDNGIEYKVIPVGTTGDVVLNTYYTSLRNLAVSKEDNNPFILEDRNNNVIYFTYEIGEIRNIPLNGDDPFWTIQSVAGLSQQKSETYTTTTTEEEANSVSNTISDMTVKSNTTTLSESWNEVTTVNESWAESIGKTAEECKTEATTSSNTLSVTDQMGGSSYHKTEDGTTVYDYDSKTETKDKGHTFDASLSGKYANKMGANLGSSTEYGTEASYNVDNAYTKEGKITADNWSASGSSSGSSSSSGSASDKDKYSAGISYENGFEVNAGLNYGYHNNTNTVTKTGSDSVTVNSAIDENTSSWNSSSTFSATNQHSVSQTVRNTLSDVVTTTKGYGKTYSNGGTDSTTQGFSSTASNTSGTTSTTTYSKLESKTTTTTYSVDGHIEGKYRCILVGKAHVFGVVGYDYNTKSYFTYTFNVMDDKTEEFLDYTPKGADFDDCENSCLPFEIPTDIFDYVNDRTSKTTGVQFRTDSVNGTARITGYAGNDSNVIIPSYVSDGKQAYKVTEIASSAFAGKPVRSVVLGEFIKSIPDGAFKDCAKLEEVLGSFTEIGKEAFAGCVKLTNMNIPSNVVKIGENAFSGVNSINVRAINSLSAYAQAVKALPDNPSDEKLEEKREAKKKKLTQEFIQSVLDCGAQNIVLDISNIAEDTELTLEVPEINSIEINGGEKSYKNFSINSHAKNTSLSEMTIENTNGTPLTIDSDKLTLHKMIATGKSTALILKNDGMVLALDQDNTIKSTSKYAIIGKNPIIESQVSGSGAVGFLNVIGDFGFVNSIEGEDYIDFTNGELIKISEEEFWKYVQGACNITFDANGGTLEAGSESTQVMLNEMIESMPIPTRDHYSFDGWYTAAEGGDKVDENTPVTTVGEMTLYAHWKLIPYTVCWENGTGYTATVERTSSPNANEKIGSLENNEAIYYGDVLSIKYAANEGYSLSDIGATDITVTGNVTKDDIYASTEALDVTYNVVYKSTNGTKLDSVATTGPLTLTYKYGTTNTITPPAKTGYTTPDKKSVKWDSATSKTITFEYSPKPIGTQTVKTGTWTSWGSTTISYAARVEIGTRTASNVKLRVVWTNSVSCPSYFYYGYRQIFSASLGGSSTGTVEIASSSQWMNQSYNGASATGTSNWITVSASATKTSVPISLNWSDLDGVSGSWSGNVTIPAY